MLTKFLLILALAWQPLVLHAVGVGAPSVQSPVSRSSGCCPVVVGSSCCSKRVVEHHCGKTDDECRCSAKPSNQIPKPKTPMPMPSSDPAPVVLTGEPGIVLVLTKPARPMMWASEPGIPIGHNRAQALLGVWRT